jgi:hypothetical protein
MRTSRGDPRTGGTYTDLRREVRYPELGITVLAGSPSNRSSASALPLLGCGRGFWACRVPLRRHSGWLAARCMATGTTAPVTWRARTVPMPSSGLSRLGVGGGVFVQVRACARSGCSGVNNPLAAGIAIWRAPYILFNPGNAYRPPPHPLSAAHLGRPLAFTQSRLLVKDRAKLDRSTRPRTGVSRSMTASPIGWPVAAS